tara:strand:+ start:5343 stop:7673 length:2331 start_codon:yes stop_codon:yes gene_type:complete
MTEAQKRKARREELAQKEQERRAAERAREEERKFMEDYTEFMKDREQYNDRAFQLFQNKRNKERQAAIEEKKAEEERNKNATKAAQEWQRENKIKAKERKERKDAEDYIISSENTSKNISKDMTKILKKNTTEIYKSAGIIDDGIIKANKARREQILAELKSGDLSDEQIKNRKAELDYLNASGELQNQILKESDEGTLTEQSKDEVRKSILEKMGLTVDAYDRMSDAEKESAGLMVNGVDKIDEVAIKLSDSTKILKSESFEAMVDEIKTMSNEFDELIDKSKKWGVILQDPAARMIAARAALAAFTINLVKDTVKGAVELRQELGLSLGNAMGLSIEIQTVGKAMEKLGGDAAELNNFTVEIGKEFGNVGEVNKDILTQFADLNISLGLSGQEAASLAKSIRNIQGGSLEASLNTIVMYENMAAAAGVAPSLVIKDIAENTEHFAKFAKDGGKNIAEAAAKARKLGLELKDVASIAESLLDFETSIEAQMEAQVITGRNLNLDRARMLAMEGKHAELMDEIKNNVVSQAEFNQMSFIEREKLAKAVGLEVQDMAALISGGKTQAMIEEDRAKKEEERLVTQQELMESMVLFQQLMVGLQAIDTTRLLLNQMMNAEKLKGLGHSAKEAILNKRNLVVEMAQAVAAATKTAFKNPAYLLIGMGLAAAAGLFVMSQMKKAKGFALGGDAVKDGGPIASSDTIPAMLTPGEIVLNKAQQRNVASSVVGGSTKALESKMDSQIKETKEANKNSAKLLEQNQILMSKLIRETGNLKLQNL